MRRLMSSSAVSGPTVLRRLVGPGLVGRLVLRLPTRLVGRLLTREPEGASSGPGSAPDRITCGTKNQTQAWRRDGAAEAAHDGGGEGGDGAGGCGIPV